MDLISDLRRAQLLIASIQEVGAFATMRSKVADLSGGGVDQDGMAVYLHEHIPAGWVKLARALPPGSDEAIFLAAACDLLKNEIALTPATRVLQRHVDFGYGRIQDIRNAREVGDRLIAQQAVRDMSPAMTDMLDSVIRYLCIDPGARRSRRSNVERTEVTIQEFRQLPFNEVAAILGLVANDSNDSMSDLLAQDLDRTTSAERSKRVAAALRSLEEMREELQSIGLTPDVQSRRYEELLIRVVRIGSAVATALAVTPLVAVTLGEPVARELVKAGITTLVVVTMGEATDVGIRAWRDSRPSVRLNEAHDRFGQAVERYCQLAQSPDPPVNPSAESVAKAQLLASIYNEQCALLEINGSDKAQYFRGLKDLMDAVSEGCDAAQVLRLVESIKLAPMPQTEEPDRPRVTHVDDFDENVPSRTNLLDSPTEPDCSVWPSPESSEDQLSGGFEPGARDSTSERNWSKLDPGHYPG